MTPSNHTTSLELSIALKKAGWPQESLFYWVDNSVWYHLETSCVQDHGISAPTASELMERMPDGVDIWRAPAKSIDAGKWVCTTDYGGGFADEIIPNALAKLVLYLVKEGMMKF